PPVPVVARCAGAPCADPDTTAAPAGASVPQLGGEAADLLYHLIVLLQSRGMHLSDVLGTLAERQK
ncbi:MAG: bifunctional phosphoribosyl-AMP cyclohydrolase/phosphoribosyl-ATP diphosphatase, partial [Proteobacteria bacterium]|nr:bifunctional phosphoribosyl-AMP cyclohydrolase/phosphoribosyl-ATP diphosphatase [Pseudomonadota bacterium]